MVSLNMIDTQGGIKRIFQAQRRRFYPLPDYDLSQPERAMMTLRGAHSGRALHPVADGTGWAGPGQKAQHIRNRGFDSQYCRDMIVALVREHQPVSREDIDKLPEVLTQAQKLTKIHNLLSSQSGSVLNGLCKSA